jgi:hypothetical protein
MANTAAAVGGLTIGVSNFWPTAGVPAVSAGDLLDIKLSWNFFEQVQNSNATISTMRGTEIVNPLTPAFYTFRDSSERLLFQQGQFWHQQMFPAQRFEAISKQ